MLHAQPQVVLVTGQEEEAVHLMARNSALGQRPQGPGLVVIEECLLETISNYLYTLSLTPTPSLRNK